MIDKNDLIDGEQYIPEEDKRHFESLPDKYWTNNYKSFKKPVDTGEWFVPMPND